LTSAADTMLQVADEWVRVGLGLDGREVAAGADVGELADPRCDTEAFLPQAPSATATTITITITAPRLGGIVQAV